jgi:cytochrome c biogenesis protein CcmG, thiol:disulfide interchange protein DsbE
MRGESVTRRQQWMLFAAIVLVGASAIGLTTYGLRDEIFPVDVGVRAPDFQAVTLFSHDTRTLADYKGQVVLLNVWATWCAPCRIEMPSLEALNKEYGPKGLKIIGINTHDEANDSTVRAFANGYGLTFDILRDMPAAGQDSMTAIYKITGYPESFVIDQSGMIRKKWAAYDDWSSQGNRALIAQLLGLPVPSPVTPRLGDTALRPRPR